MHAFREELRFTKDCEMTQLYALSVLHDFHALQFPGQYLGAPPLGRAPDDVNDPIFKIARFGLVEEMERTETALLQPGMKPADIAAKIMDPARPLLDFLASYYQGQDIYKTMVDYCNWQKRRHYKKSEKDVLADNDGNRLHARQILPPADVVKAMHDYWNVRNLRRCTPLEKYIGITLAGHAA